MTSAVHENVRRFDVAVKHAAVMSGVQGIGDLYGQVKRPVYLEGAGLRGWRSKPPSSSITM